MHEYESQLTANIFILICSLNVLLNCPNKIIQYLLFGCLNNSNQIHPKVREALKRTWTQFQSKLYILYVCFEMIENWEYTKAFNKYIEKLISA